jgi:hypothetical protein
LKTFLVEKVIELMYEELESNVMYKLGVNLIQYPNYSCMGVYTSSQTQEVP